MITDLEFAAVLDSSMRPASPNGNTVRGAKSRDVG
jgi:hypothetical protein